MVYQWVFLSHSTLQTRFRPIVKWLWVNCGWTRIHELPLEYYSQIGLHKIRPAFGKVLHFHCILLVRIVGASVWICIQINYITLLIPTIIIKGKHHKVQYEGLPKLCTSCSCIEHQMDSCLTLNAKIASDHAQHVFLMSNAINDNLVESVEVDSTNHTSNKTSITNVKINPTYDEWI